MLPLNVLILKDENIDHCIRMYNDLQHNRFGIEWGDNDCYENLCHNHRENDGHLHDQNWDQKYCEMQ